MILEKIKLSLEGREPISDDVTNLVNLIVRASEVNVLKKDAWSMEQVEELQRHAELGNNLITTNHIALLKDAEEKIEKRKKIESYVQTLRDYMKANNDKLKEINEEKSTIDEHMKIFIEIKRHITDNGHLTRVMLVLEEAEILGNSTLNIVKQTEELGVRIIERYEDKLIQINNKIKEIEIDNKLFNEEIKLIQSYDVDSNYLNFD